MNRRNAALVTGGAVLILLAWFALLWSPRGGDLADARERRTAAEQQVDQLQARLAKLQAGRRDAAALQARAAGVRGAVPEHADMAALLLDLDGAAHDAGIELSSVQPSPVAASATGGPNEIPLAITVKGGYFRVLDFTDRVLALPRIVVIDTFDVSSGEGDVANLLTVQFGARTFTHQAIGTATAPTGAAPAPPAEPTAAPATTPPSGGTMEP